ncbi:MAG: hypothetical protein L6243_03465 [Candidatus Altiarchaeales archaeon]|nr:hypothetical protein [Candidatus Altiarchaeota archaeon]MBU4342239.1 hypothetical protein [Candidatus Altiarchaeota archaeon]MBU4406801.1 hypothetical protein [Candidatus Altiarchaeota archaeon]MBU4436714.1 hypothetical protein [Candidatus Altiarchaeota archaeon]MCG2782628.1 hypothetical protein [Candidatus Altiarchaeales archaeon]
MIPIRRSSDIDYVRNDTILLASKLTDSMIGKINKANVKKVVTTPAFYEKHEGQIKRITHPLEVRKKRERKTYRPLTLPPIIQKDLEKLTNQIILRPLASYLYSNRPQDMGVIEVVSDKKIKKPSSRHEIINYVIPKGQYDLVKKRSEIVVLNGSSEKTKLYVPHINDSIQFQLNIQTIPSLYDIAHQIRNVKQPNFILPFNRLIAEDWFNVVVKNKNPRFVHVPFTLDEIIRK